MLRGDTRAAAEAAAATVHGPGVRQYWDGERILSRALAERLSLGPAVRAWDVYLFFAFDAAWRGGPPEPIEWLHQLHAAPPERFRGGRLEPALHEAVDRLRPLPVEPPSAPHGR